LEWNLERRIAAVKYVDDLRAGVARTQEHLDWGTPDCVNRRVRDRQVESDTVIDVVLLQVRQNQGRPFPLSMRLSLVGEITTKL
jgi:hypothetical protein